MHGFVQKVRRTICDHRLIEPRAPVAVAVSGGPDSVAAARALHALRHPLTLVYVDHGTRPETADEARFVGVLAETLGAAFVSLGCEPAGLSEAALREARYAALALDVAARGATGHTASDQAETVLMRILRGTGSAGLVGIPLRRGRYVRPLLEVERSDVLAWLEELGQPWCTDPTNASLDPLRNRIRHELLPALERDYQPGAGRALARLAAAARTDRAYLEHAARDHLARHGLALDALRAAHPGLRAHIFRGASPVPIPGERLAAIERALEQGRGVVQLEGLVEARLDPRANALEFVDGTTPEAT